MKQLPEKAPELILVALEDLEKCEQDTGTYEIDMFVWHTSSIRNRCAVCLGGAVMAQSLDVSPFDSVMPETLPESIRVKLMALDSFRVGQLSMGLWHLGYGNIDIDNYETISYNESPSLFKVQMKDIARILADKGY